MLNDVVPSGFSQLALFDYVQPQAISDQMDAGTLTA